MSCKGCAVRTYHYYSWAFHGSLRLTPRKNPHPDSSEGNQRQTGTLLIIDSVCVSPRLSVDVTPDVGHGAKLERIRNPRGMPWLRYHAPRRGCPARGNSKGSSVQAGSGTDLKRWGLHLAERGGKRAKKKAVLAVARKLGLLLHRLWVTGEVYEPLRNSKVAQERKRAAA